MPRKTAHQLVPINDIDEIDEEEQDGAGVDNDNTTMNNTVNQLNRSSELCVNGVDEKKFSSITQVDDDRKNTKWIIFGDEDMKSPKISLEDEYCEFVKHLEHVSSIRAEFDIYQTLAFRSKIKENDNIYLKPFKTLKGSISDRWSELQICWFNSYQRVLIQAAVCFVIQTIGITTILITQFAAYFNDESERAKCDYHIERWKSDAHLKLLAFLWTGFISLGVSGWVYKARHSGFYKILLFMKSPKIAYPSFVSITILQFGLLINYYVIASSVFGSYILIYSTEGGTETIGMVLQAVALFFVLELDYTIVHKRDFLCINKYFTKYIKNNKHKQLPSRQESDALFQRSCYKNLCYGQSCLQSTLDIISFILLVIMTVAAVIAPFLIAICW